jgi:hypothetical protein
MTKEEIEEILYLNTEWKEAPPEEKEYFFHVMKPRLYGYSPLHNAWGFFHEGWEACSKALRDG